MPLANSFKHSNPPIDDPMKRVFTPAKKKTILIVDDDPLVVHIYREKFQSQGFKVEIVDGGDSAIQRVKKDVVDLMIVDLCVPGMNGVEILKSIRSQSDTQSLPIFAFSNAYLGNLTRAASEAGATRCITKADSSPEQLLELIREALSVGQTSAIGQPATELYGKLAAMLIVNAPETLMKLRSSYQLFARTEEEELRRTKLFEMHRQLRSLAGAAGLVGFRRITQMATALEALFIELHTKPQKITQSVIRTVAQAVDILASLFDRAANPQPEVSTPPKILVVDDEIISRETICSALGKAGLGPMSLDDAISAQRLLEQDHFDLIFLDVEMPGQSGLELCVKIREMAPNCATPVVFVTSHSDFGSRARSTLSGGNDFIAKPFLMAELAVKALTWLFKKTPQPPSTTSAKDTAPAKMISHESELSENHLALGVHKGSVSEVNTSCHEHRTAE